MTSLDLPKFGLQSLKKQLNFKVEFVLYVLLGLLDLDRFFGMLSGFVLLRQRYHVDQRLDIELRDVPLVHFSLDLLQVV